jgi:hypothetical protein
LDLPCAPRTLQHHANKAGARRFKKPRQTKISQKNCLLRRQYGSENATKTITKFWSRIWFIDEAHFQSIKLRHTPKYELRYPGQERGINEVDTSGLDVTVHVAAGISYNHKGPLIFYKDPVEPSEKQRKPAPPRKSKYETQSDYEGRVKAFQDTQPKEDTTPKGNCMTQVFYAKNILPQHIKQIQALEARHKCKYWLQEDGDPSHGIKSQNSPPTHLKRDADLLLLVHPPQSPDLNPIESCWNIIKARLAGRRWSTVADFKADIQAEWDKITLTQIRRRIREMPMRCKKIQDAPEVRIKSDVW